jgi:hypothetical protein
MFFFSSCLFLFSLSPSPLCIPARPAPPPPSPSFLCYTHTYLQKLFFRAPTPSLPNYRVATSHNGFKLRQQCHDFTQL